MRSGRYCICNDAEANENMKNCLAAATALIAMGDMRSYVPNSINLHYWPLDLSNRKPAISFPHQGRPLRVAHAPNYPQFKGTAYLEAAINRLQSEGKKIELIRVHGVSNERVLEIFASADLVADQFVSGFHGYTTLEAMSLGKCVLCYVRSSEMMVDPGLSPIINVNPDNLYDVLKACVDGEIDLAAFIRSRRYVERYYSLEAVAIRLGRLYIATGSLPPNVARIVEGRLKELEEDLSEIVLTGSVATTASSSSK